MPSKIFHFSSLSFCSVGFGPRNFSQGNLPCPLTCLDKSTKIYETGLTLYTTHSVLGATRDGRVVENEGSSEDLLEIKCPYSIKGQNISHYVIPDILSMNDKNFSLEMLTTKSTLTEAHTYYAQVQGKITINVLPWVVFVVWIAAASSKCSLKEVFFSMCILFHL